MQTTKRTLTLLTCAVALTAFCTTARADDDPALAKAVAAFYVALNAMFEGDAAPMEAVWSQSDDATYMPPDGKILAGWDAVRNSWRQQASLNLGGEVQPEEIRITSSSDLALVRSFEKGHNVVAGKSVPVHIRATKVYRKEAGGWKLLHHHVDPLPFLTD